MAPWSQPIIALVSASFVLIAICAFSVLYALLGELGKSSCDIYCGPPGILVGSLILVPITFVLWLAGLVLAAVAVLVSRAQSWLAWSALGLSLVIPLALVISVANIGFGNFASY